MDKPDSIVNDGPAYDFSALVFVAAAVDFVRILFFFYNARLTDYATLLDNIQSLKDGKSTEVPIYDFKLSKRVGYRHVEVPKARVVIIEGIYALSERLRPLLDLRVSVTGGVHFDLLKRVMRDIHRSGQEPESIIHQISETVYPMYKAYIEPDLKTAHRCSRSSRGCRRPSASASPR